MLFDVYVQNNFYKTIVASNITDVLKLVGIDISNDVIPNFDKTKSHDIRIMPQENT